MDEQGIEGAVALSDDGLGRIEGQLIGRTDHKTLQGESHLSGWAYSMALLRGLLRV